MENKMPKANLSRQYSMADSETALTLGSRQHFSPSAPVPAVQPPPRASQGSRCAPK